MIYITIFHAAAMFGKCSAIYVEPLEEESYRKALNITFGSSVIIVW